MLRSVLLKSLRDQRVPAIAWGLAFGVIVMLNAVGWSRSYPDAASRQRLAMLVQSGTLSSAAVLFGLPHHIDQLPGWMEWRAIGFVRILMGIIAALTAAGLTRGSEESGTIECVLAATSSRTRVCLGQSGATMASIAITCTVVWVFIIASPPLAGEPRIPLMHALGAAANLFGAGALAASVTLLAGQFTTSQRSAGLIGGSIVIAMHIWDNLCAITPSMSSLRAISPYYLYSMSSPLGDGKLNLAALGSLLFLAAAITGVAVWLTGRRDFGGVIGLPWRSRSKAAPASNVVEGRRGADFGLRNAFARGLSENRVPILAWGVGLGLFSALMTAVEPSLKQVYTDSSGPLRSVLKGQITDTRLISFLVFGFMPLFASFYAVTLASGWAREEVDGRLELELACPISRVGFFLQRLGAAVVATMLVIAMAGAGMYIAAAVAHIDLSWGKAAVSLLLLMPFAASIVSFCFWVSSLRPRLVVGFGSLMVLASYLIDLLVPLFGWPNAIRSVSVFHLYGTPLSSGVDWPSTMALILVGLAFTGAGSLAFSRRDVAR